MLAATQLTPVLHRRRPSDLAVPGPAAAPPRPPANTAYQPLRRLSSQLYPSQPSASARYPVPVSPYESAGAGYGFPSAGLGASPAAYGDDRLSPFARAAVTRVLDGARDAVRLDRSWALVWGDLELRTLVLKSTLVNLLSLFFLSLFPLLSPFLSSSAASQLVQTRTQEVGLWYNVLLSWPVFLVCFWINASWGPDISRRAQTMLHPAYRHQPSTPSPPAAPFDPVAFARASATRLLLIADFTLVARTLRLVPALGAPLAFAYMCIINAYYSFEWTFASRGWPLDVRADFVADRAAYMFGFGLPATLLSSFAPPLVNMAVFALIYPFLVIQALQSRPPMSSHSGLLTPPSPGMSPRTPLTPLTPDGEFFPPSRSPAPSLTVAGARAALARARVPIFLGARYAVGLVDWLGDALERDRTGGHRRRSDRGKRLG